MLTRGRSKIAPAPACRNAPKPMNTSKFPRQQIYYHEIKKVKPGFLESNFPTTGCPASLAREPNAFFDASTCVWYLPRLPVRLCLVMRGCYRLNRLCSQTFFNDRKSRRGWVVENPSHVKTVQNERILLVGVSRRHFHSFAVTFVARYWRTCCGPTFFCYLPFSASAPQGTMVQRTLPPRP